ncbi:ribonucleoside-diphosphate reductase subunit alpha [Candidatus Dependentiae bacterium]|nr:ribonucleoside-diphosphate reductase subunit alpha [Candidatus Dependentiae bacterium]
MEQVLKNSSSAAGLFSGPELEVVASISVVKRDGVRALCSVEKLYATLSRLASDLPHVSFTRVMKAVVAQLYDGISTRDLEDVLVLSITPFIEEDPEYSFLASRALLQKIYKEVFGKSYQEQEFQSLYKQSFIDSITRGVAAGDFDGRLLEFDLQKLADHICTDRDLKFKYTGIQTLAYRYFKKLDEKIIEAPQAFWMRVAMGLCIQEPQKNEQAIEFYNLLSHLRYSSGTPTLLHSGLVVAQLSSCYLTTVADDLVNIFKCYGDNAQLSKWSGGIGNDWTNIRSTGATIKTIGMPGQGLIPFLKIANDVTSTISRSGNRRGATCAYLEPWHADYEDFLDLRRNTGDDRRRAHDMNTASWIPDLLVKRVMEDSTWAFISPHEAPDLHSSYGRAFEEAFVKYEQLGREGKLKTFRVIGARELWRKMLTRLFETGHPWFVFKDPCNIRSPQDHVGVVNSSNLCTEITLNTSSTETAVCNIGSINLAEHVKNGVFQYDMLAQSIKTAMRMLDNVIEINFYPTSEAKASNLKHRPVGLGIMGLQDVFFALDLPFEDAKTAEFVDELMEFFSFHAIKASAELAKERGAYTTFKGSKWDRGLLPLDTLNLLEQERGMLVEVDRKSRLNWGEVRDLIVQHGMRNSNTMAIAPTATISNILGAFPSFEPMYKNIYVKANLCGEFTIINEFLVEDLKKLNLWNASMREQIKYYDGSVQRIANIPVHLKEKYKEAFEIDPFVQLKLTALRGKWVDQSQSHNIFIATPTGKLLSDVYIAAWKMGLKSTYYLRTMGATQIEKSTLDASKYGFTQNRSYDVVAEGLSKAAGSSEPQVEDGQACSIENPECESCQ